MMFKDYRKKNTQPMRPYMMGEDLEGITVSDGDIPESGGMIAVNTGNHDDMWYVPQEFFEDNYEEVVTDGMSFGLAIGAMKCGFKVARKGWNGRDMWLILVPGSNQIIPDYDTAYSRAGISGEININPHIDMMTASGEMQPGWLASQTDVLADDWFIV